MEIESGSMNFFAGNDDAAKMLNVDEKWILIFAKSYLKLYSWWNCSWCDFKMVCNLIKYSPLKTLYRQKYQKKAVKFLLLKILLIINGH